MRTFIQFLALLFAQIVFVSCSEDLETNPEEQLYEVSIKPTVSHVQVSQGRTGDNSEEIDWMNFWLYDESCSIIDEQYRNDPENNVDYVVLPNLKAGEYSYIMEVYGNSGIRYSEGLFFEIYSDTSFDASLENYQTRFRINDISGFHQDHVSRIECQFNFSEHQYYVVPSCEYSGSGEWHTDEYEDYLSMSLYPPNTMTRFLYYDPFKVRSISVKYYNTDDQVLKHHIIEIDEIWLKQHTSYTFEVDFEGIWNGADENGRIYVNWIEVDWKEEDIRIG